MLDIGAKPNLSIGLQILGRAIKTMLTYTNDTGVGYLSDNRTEKKGYNLLAVLQNFDKFYLIFLLLVLLISLTVFRKMEPDEFLFMHDEYIASKTSDIDSLLSPINLSGLGTPYLYLVINTLYDAIYYTILGKAQVDIQISTRLLYIFKLLLITIIPYTAFKRLFHQASQFKDKQNKYVPFVVSLWYSLNTFTVISWNTYGFSLTSVITYSLAPLCYYTFFKSIKRGSKNTLLWFTNLLLFLMSFSTYLYAVFLLILLFSTVLELLYDNRSDYKISKLLKIIVLHAPYSVFYTAVFLNSDFISSNMETIKFGATYTNVRSLLHIMRGLYNWVLYTKWSPKSIATFSTYYQGLFVTLTSLLLLALTVIMALKQKKSSYVHLLAILAVLLLLAKGDKPPSGNIFTFLYNNIPGFVIFRTPDTKFGFGIVFIIAMAMTYTWGRYRKLVALVLPPVIILQSLPLLTGEALIGRETERSHDRKVKIQTEYQGYINYINDNNRPYGYIFTIPNSNDGVFFLGNSDFHIGRDLLPYFTSLPYLSINDYSITNPGIKRVLTNLRIDEETLRWLSTYFPIRFFVLREDIRTEENITSVKQLLNKHLKIVYTNRLFTVYENPAYRGLVSADNSAYERISSVHHVLRLRNISQQSVITLLQTSSPGWVLYIKKYGEGGKSHPATTMSVLKYLFINHYPDYMRVYDRYNLFNSWLLKTSLIKDIYPSSHYKINPDGTLDLDITIYYLPNAIYMLSILFVALYTLLGTLMFLTLEKHKQNSNKMQHNNHAD